MNQVRLAIVIPAYKPDFLDETLASLASQGNKDFMVYIGDDCSPYHLYDIVCKYESLIQIIYHRFDTNLGSKDLVAQWERCIALSKDEEFIWLFSDDDVMESNCVEEFYRCLDQTNNKYDLYHFDINIIDEEEKVVNVCPKFPLINSSWDYYKAIVYGRQLSYVVEYIFSRKIYEKSGGFVNFDLAWNSDKATWTEFCGNRGLCTIESARVNWRRSQKNITPNMTRSISERKMMANCLFFEWAFKKFNNTYPEVFYLNRKLFILKMGMHKSSMSHSCFKNAFRHFFKVHGHSLYILPTYIGILIKSIKIHLKSLLISNR